MPDVRRELHFTGTSVVLQGFLVELLTESGEKDLR
jgi:hypothetical protein